MSVRVCKSSDTSCVSELGDVEMVRTVSMILARLSWSFGASAGISVMKDLRAGSDQLEDSPVPDS